jgi:hypothetical protein
MEGHYWQFEHTQWCPTAVHEWHPPDTVHDWQERVGCAWPAGCRHVLERHTWDNEEGAQQGGSNREGGIKAPEEGADVDGMTTTTGSRRGGGDKGSYLAWQPPQSAALQEPAVSMVQEVSVVAGYLLYKHRALPNADKHGEDPLHYFGWHKRFLVLFVNRTRVMTTWRIRWMKLVPPMWGGRAIKGGELVMAMRIPQPWIYCCGPLGYSMLHIGNAHMMCWTYSCWYPPPKREQTSQGSSGICVLCAKITVFAWSQCTLYQMSYQLWNKWWWTEPWGNWPIWWCLFWTEQ